MKCKYIKTIIQFNISLFFLGVMVSCNSYLDRAPLSDVTPDDYLNTEADLAAYTIARYNFPSHGGWGLGTFATDNHTDNQASSGYSTRWVPGEWRVPASGGDWDFTNIRHINYFIETAVPKWKSNALSGNPSNVQHYIGEAYFLRAYEYFNKVQAVGDFPILKNTVRDNLEELQAISVRRPRNEVARFILQDLDSAITLLNEVSPNAKNRITKNAALLFKSRVALHEGSWLKYHNGTAQVPGGSNWPGAKSNPGFTVNMAAEIDFFLTQAMESAEQVADKITLVTNMKDNGDNSSANPYFKMFADQNLNGYAEVILWREYALSLNIAHGVNHYMNRNGGNSGYTKGLVQNFTMANGMPIYAAGSGYQGDDLITDVKDGRDNRLQLFMKAPGELSYTDRKSNTQEDMVEPNPDILGIVETRYVTGYALKKGMSYIFQESEGITGTTGSIIFRGVEAYLNYLEASYLKNGSLNGKATQYWTQIRERAGVNSDFMLTVNLTDISKEAENDWAAYSAGNLLTDKVLYNIRRERRLELIAEGMRFADLKRWRALDQLITDPYIIEGMKLWGPMQEWYTDEDGASRLIQPNTPGKTANVSSQVESSYLRPYRINLASTNLVLNGYKWHPAHYLNPIATNHFTITSPDGSPESSTIYQNPGWPLLANQGPIN